MRWAYLALLIVTWLRGGGPANAQAPLGAENHSHDRDAAVRASESSPWIDLAPALAFEPAPREDRLDRGKLASGLGVAGLYLGFSAWAYIAWYRNHPEKDDPQSIGDIWDCGIHPSHAGCDGWFGVKTYAGGADKVGHAWATMVLGRGGTALLRAGGWDRTKSAIISAVLSEGLFLAVEVKDYYFYEFSPGDFAMNTAGALAGLALDLSPRLDELIDFRVQWLGSKQYRYNFTNPNSPCAKRMPGQPSCSRWNVAEDYSGETYLLSLHLGAFKALREMKYGVISKFVDVSLAFESRNYKPPPTVPPYESDPERTQTLYIGLSLNAQGLVDHFLARKSKLRKAGHGLFEVLTPPLTVPVLGVERGASAVNSGGA